MSTWGPATENFVAAVNEIAINAIRHAGGRGHLRIHTSDPAATSGRGLWLVHRLCPTIAFTDSEHAMTVRLVTGAR